MGKMILSVMILLLLSGCAAASPSSRKVLGRSTTTATTGSTIKSTVSITDSGTRMDRFAPRELPAMAQKIVGRAIFQFTSPCRINRTVVSAVPQVEDSLLVAMVWWMGTPASK